MRCQVKLWKLRQSRDEDQSFIFSSWLKSYRNCSVAAGIPNTIYFDKQHATISRLLEKPTTLAIVACDPNDESTIYGYIIAELDASDMVLHWIYTKHSFRGFGLARALVDEIATVKVDRTYYTTRTRQASDKEMIYDPFKLWRHCE